MVLKWTKTALRQLDEIAAYIAQDNPERAVSFIKALRLQTDRLEAFPGIGRAGRVQGTRELVLHKHYITIYRVRNGEVEILRIHHTAQDL